MATPPNVLLFCVDEMRADHLACAGNPVIRTPNLDGLAARGTCFRRAYCNNPICMPARASMFTGMLPRDHGLRVNGQSLRTDVPTMPACFASAGYRTHAAGKLHLTPWVPQRQPPDPARLPECLQYWKDGNLDRFPEPYYGFQTVDFVGGHSTYAYGSYIRWLREHGGDPRMLQPEAGRPSRTGAPTCGSMEIPESLHYNRFIADSTIRAIRESTGGDSAPFFIWCSFPDPHMPIAPPPPYDRMYDPGAVPPPDVRAGELDDLPPVYRLVHQGTVKPNGVDNRGVSPAMWQEMIAMTYGMVTHVDTEIGRVLAALEQAGVADHTVVAFVCDHGDMMGDHGLLWKAFYTFSGCIRIPFILSAPGFPRGRVSDALACQIDLMPTLLDLCGIPLPGADWQRAATPFERGSVRPLRLYPGHSLRPVLEDPNTPVREDVVIENDDPTSGYWVRTLVTNRHRISVYPGTPDGELFDLETDPRELHNLWYRPEARSLRDTLAARLLDAYARETPAFPIPPWNS